MMTIRAEADPGDDIDDAMLAAGRMAWALRCRVRFWFNGCDVIISEPPNAIERREAWVRAQAVAQSDPSAHVLAQCDGVLIVRAAR